MVLVRNGWGVGEVWMGLGGVGEVLMRNGWCG